MGRGVNRVTLVGNLGRDPEVRAANTGTSVANFSVATAESIKRGDQWEDHTEWHRCVAFGRTAEVIGQYLSKGSQVYLEGRLRTRKYTGKDGIEKSSTEITVDVMNMLGGLPKQNQAQGSSWAKPPAKTVTPAQEQDFNDDIPF